MTAEGFGTLITMAEAATTPNLTSVTTLLSRLPTEARAQLRWFPEGVRRIVEQVRGATRGELRDVLDVVGLDAIRLGMRFSSAIQHLLEDPGLETVFVSRVADIETALDERVRVLLEPHDPAAADDLREAFQWCRALVVALMDTARASAAAGADGVVVSDDDLRRELRGPAGGLVRGLVSTVVCLEILDEEQAPAIFPDLCRGASLELQAAANALRAQGLSVPTAVHIPGFTPLEWQARRAPQGLGLSPRGLPVSVMTKLLKQFAPEEVWLFGSRARGTHAPDSDWDLLVVLADDDGADEDRDRRAPFWSERVDLCFTHRSDFEASRSTLGTLSHLAVTEGYRVYGR